MTQPGIKTWVGQAVWKPFKTIPELTGDVTVAVQPDGSAFIQFSKTLPFATAREDGRQWQIDFPGGRRYSGHYPLPHHFAWLQLPALVEAKPLRHPWKETGNLDDFTIENRLAGEKLKGFLSPNP